MNKLIIGFSKPNSFKIGAKLISYWMKTEYSHAYLRFEYADSKPCIFQASHGMVHFKSVSNFYKENIEVKEYSIDLDSNIHDKIFDRAMDLAGEKYSKITLAKNVIYDIIYRSFRKKIIIYNSNGYVCSELIATICQDYLNIRFDKPLYLVEPIDLDLTLAKSIYGKNPSS